MTQDQVLWVVAGPIAAAGLALPWFGHAHTGVLFGVSVPKSFESSREADRSIARYRRDCVLWALFLLALVYGCVKLAGDESWLVLAMSAAGLPLELMGCFYLWHREHVHIAKLRGRLAELAATEGEELPPSSWSSKDNLPTPDRPVMPLLLATAAFLPLIVMALYLESHWNSIPETFPQHWNAAGHADGWGERTPLTVFSPLLFGSAAVLVVAAATVLVGLAPGPDSRHRMRTLAPLAALAWLLSLVFSIASLLPVLGSFSILHAGAVAVFLILLSVALVLWMLIRTAPGLPGAKPLHRSTSEDHWHGGVFYANPDDASLLVPKRFGWGWTLNVSRPAAWAIMLVILLLTTAMLWLPRVIAR